MLRDTAIGILDRPLNRQSAFRIVEVLHSKFTPKLTWHYKAQLVTEFHSYKKSRHATWNVKRTAEALEITEQYVYDSLKLEQWAKMYPQLKRVSDRKTALSLCIQDIPEMTRAMEIDKAVEGQYG